MSRFTDFLDRIDGHLAAGDWRGALVEITNGVMQVVADPHAKAVVFGSPEVDRRCGAAGAQLAATLNLAAPPAHDEALDVYIATEIMKNSGGHMHALRDVIHARPQARHVVLLTNLHNKDLELPDLADGSGAKVQILVAPPGDIGLKAAWMLNALAQLKPGRLLLFNHHHDAACVAAAQPGFAATTVYYHHCDHDMALGVYLPHAVHVDCTNMAHEICRLQLGVDAPHYWPLVARDLGVRAAGHAFLAQPQGLQTCSHGSVAKFMAAGRWDYFAVMRQRLQQLPGTHWHIGGLPAPVVAQMHAAMAAEGLDPARFVHVQHVPSLWTWLRDSAVDIVISSFPFQGAKGLVETMGAGLPVLAHDGQLTKQHATPDLVYPGVLTWRTPQEMVRVLGALDATTLAAQAQAARAHYLSWHHPRELAYAVNNGRLSAPMPPVYRPHPDTLALHWR